MSEAKVISIFSTKIIQETCSVCNVPFGISEVAIKQRLADGKPFYCTNGHNLIYTNSTASKLEKLQEEMKKVEEKLAKTEKILAACKQGLENIDKIEQNGMLDHGLVMAKLIASRVILQIKELE